MAGCWWAIAALVVAPLLWADPAGAETTIEVEAGYAGSFVPGQEVPVRVRVSTDRLLRATPRDDDPPRRKSSSSPPSAGVVSRGHRSDSAGARWCVPVALHILQAAIVYVNTLMVQEVFALTEWEGVLTVDDRRGRTPLFWSHILPYGEVRLNMARRLPLGSPTPALDEDAS